MVASESRSCKKAFTTEFRDKEYIYKNYNSTENFFRTGKRSIHFCQHSLYQWEGQF